MKNSHKAVVCQYRYDPLNRLLTQSFPSEPSTTTYLYADNRLATEVQGSTSSTLMRVMGENRVIAQHRAHNGIKDTVLLACDAQNSPLVARAELDHEQHAYTAYGFSPDNINSVSLLGYTGERQDVVTGHYLLGRGRRAYNPVLMRFNSPDLLSPFERGGINRYTYCTGDPINLIDPEATNAISHFFRSFFKAFKGASKKTSEPVEQVLEDGSVLIGYHGASNEQINQLISQGLHNNYVPTRSGREVFGRGFYVTRKPEVARVYANKLALSRAKRKTGSVVAVYLKNPKDKIHGIDQHFTFATLSKNTTYKKLIKLIEKNEDIVLKNKIHPHITLIKLPSAKHLPVVINRELRMR